MTTTILSSCGIFNNNHSSSENNVSSSEISSTSISSTIDYTSLNVISLDSDSCSTGLFKYSTGSYGDFYNGYRFDDETTLSTGKPVVENIQTIIKMHTSLDIEDFMGAQDPGSYIIDRTTMEGKQATEEE